VDIERRRVRVGAEEVHLTPTEYDLLKTFISQPDKVLTDRMLLRAVWGPEYGSEAHYLHVYVARLRRKIEKDPQRPRYLLTEPGVGYRLVTEQP
jgi:two-component system KDP operon response regulator KdpE